MRQCLLKGKVCKIVSLIGWQITVNCTDCFLPIPNQVRNPTYGSCCRTKNTGCRSSVVSVDCQSTAYLSWHPRLLLVDSTVRRAVEYVLNFSVDKRCCFCRS